MKISKSFWTFAGIGLALVAVVALIGCFADLSPTSVEQRADSGRAEVARSAEPNFLTYDNSEQIGAAKLAGASTSEVIGRRGGRLYLQVGSALKVSFEVPRNALETSVMITMSVDNTGKIILGFKPDGIVFKKSAVLKVWRSAPTSDPLYLYWYDPVAESWVRLDTPVYVDAKGWITTTVSHFSLYGLGDGKP